MPGHLDQFPYINIWQILVAHPPSWLKRCFEDNCKIMITRATNTGTNDMQTYAQTAFPKAEPAWDPNEAES
jgi:hypothetical protein